MSPQVLRKRGGIIRCNNPNCQDLIREGDLYEKTQVSRSKDAYYCQECADAEVLVFQRQNKGFVNPTERKKSWKRTFKQFQKSPRDNIHGFFNWRISQYVTESLVKYGDMSHAYDLCLADVKSIPKRE